MQSVCMLELFSNNYPQSHTLTNTCTHSQTYAHTHTCTHTLTHTINMYKHSHLHMFKESLLRFINRMTRPSYHSEPFKSTTGNKNDHKLICSTNSCFHKICILLTTVIQSPPPPPLYLLTVIIERRFSLL